MTQSPSSNNFKIGVIVASLGRPEEIGQLLAHLRRQTLAPNQIVVSVTGSNDLPAALPPDVDLLIGPKGSCVQRNRALEIALDKNDIIAFFDDDYVPCDDALENIAAFFSHNLDVAGAHGILLADGINSPGISYDDSLEILKQWDLQANKYDYFYTRPAPGLYGCNMVLRSAAISTERFDERLPLYGWQEDIDFSARVGKRGRIVACRAFAGVHRGVKNGRTSGYRFGYSQISNPAYLVQKGTISPGYALKIMSRNILANHIRLLRPEPWTDRHGRMRGNWLALWHLLNQRCDPVNILNLP